MGLASKKHFLSIVAALVLAISIPVTILFLQQKQDNRSKASASTTLSLIPSTPINVTAGNTFSIDLMVNPGTNWVTFVKFQIMYDPTKVQIATTNPFTLNTASFVKVDGPVVGNGYIAESVSIGSDPSKVIQQPTKIGTLNFKAIASTNNTQSAISFGSNTSVLSSGLNDQSNENVLSTTIPAAVIIAAIPVTPTLVPTATPTKVPTPTPKPTYKPTPTPTLEPGNTDVTLSLLLHGIGAAGDSANPTGNSFSNKNPLHPARSVDFSIYDSNNALLQKTTEAIIYNAQNGTYNGTFAVQLDAGSYTMRIKTKQHLTRRIPGIITIKGGQNNVVATVDQVSGDSNDDNTLSILDYNELIYCYKDLVENDSCSKDQIDAADLNDDGSVNFVDYNLFIREIGNQSGD